MRKITVLWSSILAALSACSALAQTSGPAGRIAWLAPPRAAIAPQAADQKKGPQWKTREEYDAYTAMATEKDPQKKISLAEAVIQKYPGSDFKDSAYVTEMGAYYQLGKSDKAIEAGQKALEVNPDNLDALSFSSFTFPFVFKADDPDKDSKLTRADAQAKHGLEALQKLQKPDKVTDEQFNSFVKAKRALFNAASGFVALQKKDYPGAITAYKAATEDNATDFYAFYRMGLAYLFSNPRDYDHAIWYMAHAVSLAQAARDQNAEAFQKYLKQTYVGYHGNDKGLSDILTQAAGSANPPEGFKVAAMETPKDTGDPNVDAFNQMTFPLKLGGEKAQQTWDQLKGQALELGGFIDSVEKGTDSGTYLVRIDILAQSKAANGVYDVELKDATQPNVKNLSPGDAVRFKGTLTSYTATPNLILSIDGEITTDLPDKPPVKEKPKPKPRTSPPKTTHHKTS